ncbi:acyltransferase family protein [Streptomyces longwoodensis]|uniref:acyltransferase family protein n=1 Tax=Streptomyces longwoodensis TaxID=68231 RepID=UPI0033F50A8A
MERDRYVDFLRAWAIVLVVVGHWVITGLVRHPDGTLGAPELLASVPWTQWLTLGFQIMPLFFLAGGHAAAGSWERARARGGSAAGWVGRRAVRLLLPVGAYCGLVLTGLGVAALAGVDRGTLALVGWAMAMQFWFLPVYLLLSALTPVSYAAHRRWGVWVPVGMGAVAAGVSWGTASGLGIGAGADLGAGSLSVADAFGSLNYVLVWGVVYQLGFCWRDRFLGGRPWAGGALVLGGGAAFAALVGAGPFPVSLILVTGQDPSNTNPPSAAMLAWSVGQVGLALLAAPAVRRWLERERVWRGVGRLGSLSMTLYLWHMLPVLVVAAAFYLPGLAPRPAFGSAAWWAWRVPWVLVLGAVLVCAVRALMPLERLLASLGGRLRPDARLRPGLRVWAGLAAAVPSLAYFAGHGFAPGGRLSLPAVLGLAVGTALVLVSVPGRGPGGGQGPDTARAADGRDCGRAARGGGAVAVAGAREEVGGGVVTASGARVQPGDGAGATAGTRAELGEGSVAAYGAREELGDGALAAAGTRAELGEGSAASGAHKELGDGSVAAARAQAGPDDGSVTAVTAGPG